MQNQVLLELNAFAWLNQKRQEFSRPLNLDEVPVQEWQKIWKKGFDAVWLMGVWKRSPAARKLALTHPNQIKVYDQLLPGWKKQDICASPYAVHGYAPDSFLGSSAVLRDTRERMREAGLKLILDFVPNHFAMDHPWTLSDPGLFVRGDKKHRKANPERFFQTKKGDWLAHGRDPYFAPWIDTVQVNFFSEDLRRKLTGELLRVAEICDGVRCDMAMLGLNEVFSRVWSDTVSEKAPAEEFWGEAIRKVKNRYPSFVFIAEVYWGLEDKLLELGFDFVYDKTLYDNLRAANAESVRLHLRTQENAAFSRVRFIENHDEMRAFAAFGEERSRGAAMTCALQPGLRFFHQGQAEGLKHHFPVQMARWPEASENVELAAFYEILCKELQAPVLRRGHWHLPEPKPSWEADQTYRNFVVTAWHLGEDWRLGIANLAENRSSCRIRWPFAPEKAETLLLKDLFTGTVYPRSFSEIRDHGLYVELGPGEAHLFKPCRHKPFDGGGASGL